MFEIDQHDIEIEKLINALKRMKEAGGKTIDIIPVMYSNVYRMSFVFKELQNPYSRRSLSESELKKIAKEQGVDSTDDIKSVEYNEAVKRASDDLHKKPDPTKRVKVGFFIYWKDRICFNIYNGFLSHEGRKKE